MKLFITGISGLLGVNMAMQARKQYEVSGCYYSRPVFVEGVNALRVDATSYDELGDILRGVRPDVIVNTAGLTNVDRCEEDPDLAYQLNVHITENVARISEILGASLIHISTDHLFDGTQALVDEDTPPNPLNAYARTKLEAEQVVERYSPEGLIIRTNFYGWGNSFRSSFSDWILDGLKHHKDLPMFSDVYITPILINDLIDVLFSLFKVGAAGIYNVVGRERVSKHFFGLRLAEVFGYSANRVRTLSVDQRGLKARRPKDMSLSCNKVVGLLGRQMPSVIDGLLALKDLYAQGWKEGMDRATRDGASVPGRVPVRHLGK